MYIKNKNLLKFGNHPRKARKTCVDPPHFKSPPNGRNAFWKIFTTRVDTRRFWKKNIQKHL